MKKLVAFILAITILSLVGCADGKTAGTTEPAQGGTTVPAQIPEETQTPTYEETTTEVTVPPVEGIEGTSMYNSDKFAFVITGLEPSKKGWTLKATAVNRTDMTVYMRLMNFSANGFMLETLPTVTLKPNQTKEASYILPEKELQYNSIEDITDLQFNLWVYDSQDFQTPDVADGLCRYYPYGKAAAVTYPRAPQPTDRVLVEQDRFAVTVTAVTVDKGITLELHLVNKSEKELLFIAPYATIDGTVVDPVWAYNVSAGKQRNTVITFTAKELKAAGITDAGVLELPIQIGDHSDWSAGAYFYEVFTLNLVEEPEEKPIETTEEPTIVK